VAGVVLNTSAGCARLKPGDRVWGDIGANTHAAGSGRRTKELGGYGEVAVALEAQLAKIPASIGFAAAGVLPKVALTTLKAYTWYAGYPHAARWRNASVLVLGGSGGTGSVGIMLAKAFGAATVVTTTSAQNEDYCRRLGADRIIDYRASNWWDDAVVPDGSIDVVYDTVGQAGTGDHAVAKLRRGGFYVTITGALATKVPRDVSQAMFINSDTNLASAPLLETLNTLLDAGGLRVPSIDSTFSLGALPAAFARSETGHVVGKVSIAVR